MLSSLPEGGVPEVAMIGREREMQIVKSAFAEAKRDRVPAIARVCGESGIGKTLFLSRLGNDLRADGWFVLQTACHAIQQHTPRLVSNRIVGAAIEQLAAQAPRYTGGLEDGLASFDPGIARLIGASRPVQPLDADPYAFTFLRLFEGIAVDHDVVIVCDDAQWMDTESARALLTLPQKVATGCAALAVSERDADETRAHKWFASVEVSLAELTLEESLALITAELPDVARDTAEMLAHHAAGRPIELVTLCEALRGGPDFEVEKSLRGRTAQHLASVDTGLREFVQLCALLGDPIEQRILLQLYPNAANLEKLIQQASRYVVSAGADLHFRHAVLAQSVTGTIAVPIPLHKRIVAALQGLPTLQLTDYERIAKHAGSCGDRVLEAQTYRRLADEAFERQAWSVVIAAAERTLQLHPDARYDPQLVLKYVRSLRAYEREPEAADFLLRELPVIWRDRPPGFGRIVSLLIIVLVELERSEQANAIFKKYVDSISDLPERSTLLVAAMYGALMTANDALLEEMDADFAGLREHADDRTLAFYNVLLSGRASLSGDARSASDYVAEALAYADPEDPRHHHLLKFAGLMCDFRNVGCKALSARLPELNASLHTGGDLVYGNTCEAWSRFFVGEWDDALSAVREHYDRAMPVSRACRLLAIPATTSALSDVDSGFEEEIERVAWAALEGGYRQSAMVLLPWYLLRRSDPALEKFAGELAAELLTSPPPYPVLGYIPAGFALWATARTNTTVLKELSGSQELRDKSNWAVAHWSLTRGLALQSLKNSDAKSHLADAAQRFRSLSAHFFAAFAAHNGGTATADEKSLLVTLGVSESSAPQKKSSFDLTPREWQVARLVGNGSTNRQTAEALFVSERTVEVHLGNIFGKVGITSRAQLVRWLFENEPLSPAPRK